jgi:hypothetical protein
VIYIYIITSILKLFSISQLLWENRIQIQKYLVITGIIELTLVNKWGNDSNFGVFSVKESSIYESVHSSK